MAVKVGQLPPRRVESNPRTTPLDMLNVKVGDLETIARPFALATDPKTNEQYPSRAVTSCPHCGHGIEFDVRLDLLLGHLPLTAVCDNCGAGKVAPPEPFEDPFRNPLVEGIIARSELDPLYSDQAALVVSPKTTAADRVSNRRKKPSKGSQGPTKKPATTTKKSVTAQKPTATVKAQDEATEAQDEATEAPKILDETPECVDDYPDGNSEVPLDDIEDILFPAEGPDTQPEDPIDVLGDGALEMGEEPDGDC